MRPQVKVNPGICSSSIFAFVRIVLDFFGPIDPKEKNKERKKETSATAIKVRSKFRHTLGILARLRLEP